MEREVETETERRRPCVQGETRLLQRRALSAELKLEYFLNTANCCAACDGEKQAENRLVQKAKVELHVCVRVALLATDERVGGIPSDERASLLAESRWPGSRAATLEACQT